MTKFAKLKAIAAAAATVALFSATPASAYVYAVSKTDIKDLSLLVSGADGSFGGTGTKINRFTFTIANNATFMGPVVANTTTCTNTFTNPGPCLGTPTLDTLAVNATGSTLLRNTTNNSFVMLGADNTNSYSNADTIIRTAELASFLLGGTAKTATTAISESLLNTNAAASASTVINSLTSISWDVTVAAGATLDLSFLANPDLLAEITGPAGGSFGAQAAQNTQFKVQRANGGNVTWDPHAGTAGCTNNLIGTTCTVFGGEELNQLQAGASFVPESTPVSHGDATFSAFSFKLTGMAAGDYTFTLNNTTGTDISYEYVPEPASLALVGIALVGLGIAGQRRTRKQA